MTELFIYILIGVGLILLFASIYAFHLYSKKRFCFSPINIGSLILLGMSILLTYFMYHSQIFQSALSNASFTTALEMHPSEKLGFYGVFSVIFLFLGLTFWFNIRNTNFLVGVVGTIIALILSSFIVVIIVFALIWFFGGLNKEKKRGRPRKNS